MDAVLLRRDRKLCRCSDGRARSEPGFALETFEVRVFGGQFRRQDLDDDGAAELRVDGLVDCALTARANLVQ